MIGDGCFVCFGSEFDGGVSAEDGVSSLLVAAFDGFEEEGWGGSLVFADESAVGEHGGELIGEHADGDGDDDLCVWVAAGGSGGVGGVDECGLVDTWHRKECMR